MEEISKQYNPKNTEEKWYRLWEREGCFSGRRPAGSSSNRKAPFSIVIPPPNITGILHMGHALNNTIQDILVRYHRMKQRPAVWMPGTDHAGIATQNVVERALAKKGLSRQDLGRDKFLQEVWEWNRQYGSTIIRQLKKIGASCDWERIRFTMDEEYSQAVLEVFIRLYDEGLIYQGDYIINWCPRCQTALSDEEAPHKQLNASLYYLKYPLKQSPSEFIVVATTRPETMLGDTAVAVNPKDRRYKKYIGKTLALPLLDRQIPVIADSSVDVSFGTGAVKVTPAHDPNDYQLGKRHHLEFINVMAADAKMNQNASIFCGMDRFAARKAVVEELEKNGLLLKTEPHQLSAGHCYRCHTIIEPYLSKQWFVKMKPLSRPAIEAVKNGAIKFHPGRWKKVYLNWMENIQDWCISRQIWWGHRLPVYYCRACQAGKGAKIPGSAKKSGVIVSKIKPDKCPDCGSANIVQDEDVLDTWFSSWLWPFATFGWPFKAVDETRRKQARADLEYFYPTSALVTAPEIIFFWVARMIMAGLHFIGDIPFGDVYIHGTVRDVEGKKMSKSLGNTIDPLEVINEYGADALRFSLISITAQGQDVFLSPDRFEQGRNFANKIWNASRLVLFNLDPANSRPAAQGLSVPDKSGLSELSRWIISRLNSTLKRVEKSLSTYKFNEAVNLLYGFFWHEYCDWYLELVKPDIKEPENQQVMPMVLEEFLKALHPFMPFITEEIWQAVRIQPSEETAAFIMLEPWPEIRDKMTDKKLENEMERLFGLVTRLRNLRSWLGIPLNQNVDVSVYLHSGGGKGFIRRNLKILKHAAKLNDLDILDKNIRPAGTISEVEKDADIYLHFTGALDIVQEREKIKVKIAELNKGVSRKQARLDNPEFTRKAPPEIVEKEKSGLQELESSISRLKRMLDELQ